MKTVSDIKIILYPPDESENLIVKQFLGLRDKEFIVYDDEIHLGLILPDLIQRGFSSKEVLILKQFKGRLFQKCPGSPNVICCNYLLLNTCFDCLYDCTYCFLHSYLNAFGITQFINLDGLADEIISNIDLTANKVYRIGTGEFTDSLMFDEITGIAGRLISTIAPIKNAMLEFKTKSANISHLAGIEPKGNTVLAWSLNTPRNIAMHEPGTADLDERLAGARAASDAGFYVAFHFDPVIRYDNFLEDYAAVVDRIFHSVDPSRIVWISLGCFRHSPGFKEILQNTYPDDELTSQEMFPGSDGKYRYLKSRRVEIYRYLKEKIQSYPGKPFIYLCMESSSVWQSVFNVDVRTSDELESIFSQYLWKNFLS